jgi:hypothetical protein
MKSSTKPQLVQSVEGLHAISVAAGHMASLLLVDVSSDTKEGKAGLAALQSNKWPVLKQEVGN